MWPFFDIKGYTSMCYNLFPKVEGLAVVGMT